MNLHPRTFEILARFSLVLACLFNGAATILWLTGNAILPPSPWERLSGIQSWFLADFIRLVYFSGFLIIVALASWAVRDELESRNSNEIPDRTPSLPVQNPKV